MPIVEPRKPGGFPEFLPAEQLAFTRLLRSVTDAYERHGFTPLDTPDLELTDVLLAKGGGETEKQVYSFAREGSSTHVTMRYDLTVPLARYVAEHEGQLVFPFRRYHIGKVHRAERQQKGRFREFYQCDIDVIGSHSPRVDAEFPVVINEIFSEWGFGEFTIRINDRRILTGFFESLGLAGVGVEVLRTIDKIEKITAAQLNNDLRSLGLTDEQIAAVREFTELRGTNDELLEQLSSLAGDSVRFAEGLASLRTVIAGIRSAGVPESRVAIDVKIARGLDYYTGTVYETTLNDYPELGSVCSGGRYDNLAGNYTKTSLPGVGISIGLTRLFSKLREIPGLLDVSRQTPAQVVVFPIRDEQANYATEVATALRAEGIATVLYLEDEAMKKKLRYADRMGFLHAVIVGEDEQASQTVSLKDLRTTQAETIPFAEVVARVRHTVSS